MILFLSKDVRLPIQLQRVMAAEAEAAREARAKVMCKSQQGSSVFSFPGYCGPGGAEGESGSQGGQRGHVRELRRPAAQIPPGLAIRTSYFLDY